MEIDNIDRSVVNGTQVLVDRFGSVLGLSRFKLQQILILLSVVFAWWGVLVTPIMSEGVVFATLFTCIMALDVLQIRKDDRSFAQGEVIEPSHYQEGFIRHFAVVFLVIVGTIFLLELDSIRRPLIYACAYFIAYVYISACEPRRLPEMTEN